MNWKNYPLLFGLLGAFLLNDVPTSAQPSVTDLQQYFNTIRQAPYQPLSASALTDTNNTGALIDVIIPYCNDSTEMVRSGAYYALYHGRTGDEVEISYDSPAVILARIRAKVKNPDFHAKLDELDLDEGALKRLDEDLDAAGMVDAFERTPDLVDAWKRLDDLGTDIVPDALRRNPELLEALDAPKGSRKAPSTYLDAVYIANHLKKFEDGSSRIVLKDTYLRRGVGKPDAGKTEFVFPKSEMDEILSLPNAEKAKKLGIPESQLDGELVRIDFKSTDKIEMPSGNEFGANDQWIPGGKTDGGVSEAIVKTEGMQLDVDYTVTDL